MIHGGHFRQVPETRSVSPQLNHVFISQVVKKSTLLTCSELESVHWAVRGLHLEHQGSENAAGLLLLPALCLMS